MDIEQNFTIKEPTLTAQNADEINRQKKTRAARNVIVPTSITCLEKGFLSANVRIQSLSIPSSVKYLGQGALEYCSSLQSVVLPDSITYIGQDCFNSCRSLKNIVIPESVFSIRANAFENCTSLECISIPESLSFIEDDAFSYCTSLKSIALPKELMYLGRSVFDCCHALERRNCDNGANNHVSTEIWLQKRFNGLPIHKVCYGNMKNMTKEKFAMVIEENREALHLKDAMNMTPLHILHCNPTASSKMMHMLRVAYPEAISVVDVNGMSPLMLFYASKSIKPEYYFDSVRNGPSLCSLLNQGVKCDAILQLIQYDDEMVFLQELNEGDSETGLYPFMTAASSGYYNLDVIFELMTKFPNVFRNFE